jgi:hypothetical protein
MHTDIHSARGIRIHDPGLRAGEDNSCPRPRGHLDRPNGVYMDEKNCEGCCNWKPWHLGKTETLRDINHSRRECRNVHMRGTRSSVQTAITSFWLPCLVRRPETNTIHAGGEMGLCPSSCVCGNQLVIWWIKMLLKNEAVGGMRIGKGKRCCSKI